MAENRYPEDEFDRLAAQRTIRGTHRRKESTLKWWVALVVILIFAPLAGWGIVRFASTSVSDPTPPTSSETSSSKGSRPSSPSGGSDTQQPTEPSGKPSGTGKDDPSKSPSPSGSQAGDGKADTNRPVLVLNGSGIGGFAKQNQTALQGKGFTQVSVDNYTGASPRVSTVFYPKETDRPTAVRIANTIGIPEQSVTLAPSATGGDQIVVVLKGDLRR